MGLRLAWYRWPKFIYSSIYFKYFLTPIFRALKQRSLVSFFDLIWLFLCSSFFFFLLRKSGTAMAALAAPHPTRLGPCLFLFYINDIAQTQIQQHACLRTTPWSTWPSRVTCRDDQLLQYDLDTDGWWNSTWKVCAVYSITRKKKPIHYNYTPNGHSCNRLNA